ncbi:MAG: hypothetical protein LBR10_00055 [Prevotellaceae bacterium]|jgi:hypothetical protein|nr:hypothetical protein [Prevotellaceae bacterium]
MQKASTYSSQKPVSITAQVNPANIKVNEANAQSRLSGISSAPANGKLCFALLTSFYAAQNHAPAALMQGGENTSEVGIFEVSGDRLAAAGKKPSGFPPKRMPLFPIAAESI